jgi:hypothetical protein
MTIKERLEYYLFCRKPKPKEPIRPSGIKKTVVPKEFLKTHPKWDERLFDNIEYV